MIFTVAIRAIWAVVNPILNRIPEISIDYAGISSSSIYQWLRAGLYFIPMNTVVTILTLTLALWVLRMASQPSLTAARCRGLPSAPVLSWRSGA